MQHILRYAGLHQKLASILLSIIFSKQNVQKIDTGSYLAVVLHTLKGFCMAKSAHNLDVNIVISKCWFIGVAPFERT